MVDFRVMRDRDNGQGGVKIRTLGPLWRKPKCGYQAGNWAHPIRAGVRQAFAGYGAAVGGRATDIVLHPRRQM